MRALRYKNRSAILSFVVFSLISLALLPFYHIHTEIEHVQFLDSHKHQAHQHICLIEWFASQFTNGYLDEDCEDSHEEEDAQTNKSQYLIKQGEELKKDLSLYHDFAFKIQNLKSEGQNSNYFLQINFIHSGYNFSPFCNNFSNRSPPEVLI